jgi:hypothetical protein
VISWILLQKSEESDTLQMVAYRLLFTNCVEKGRGYLQGEFTTKPASIQALLQVL